MEELLERLLAECLPYTAQGRLADYIPELAKADPSMLGVYVIGNDGKESWAGDCRQPFTIQSVIKPILLLQALLDNGATVIVIEHDLDVIRNADYVIDMGPGGGDAGGRIVASGTPQEIRENQASITGRYL